LILNRHIKKLVFLALVLLAQPPLWVAGAQHSPRGLKIAKITIGEETTQTSRRQLIEVLVKNYSSKNQRVVVKLIVTMPNQLIITFGSKRILAKAKTGTRALIVYPIGKRKAGNYLIAARIFTPGGKLIANSPEDGTKRFFAADNNHRSPKSKKGGKSAAGAQSLVMTKNVVPVNPKRVAFDPPDLLIEELSISNNNSILRGETAHIKLVVVNDGGDVAENVEFVASWYYQHRPKRILPFYKDTIRLIAPGERKVMHLPLTIRELEQKGKYLIHAVLDNANYIKESNEDNNIYTSKQFINFSDIALEFPEESHSFAEDGRFMFQWRSKQYNQFKVQVSADEQFLPDNTFELPKGQKWESAQMIQPLVGEMPALAISLMENNDTNYLYWRIRAKNSQGETTVSTGRKFFINLLAITE
jgi:hypothetical protein